MPKGMWRHKAKRKVPGTMFSFTTLPSPWAYEFPDGYAVVPSVVWRASGYVIEINVVLSIGTRSGQVDRTKFWIRFLKCTFLLQLPLFVATAWNRFLKWTFFFGLLVACIPLLAKVFMLFYTSCIYFIYIYLCLLNEKINTY